MNPQNIIEGVCADSRIGNYYNNPSFGYGGYCLPKDTKQIAYQFSEKDSLINAISKSNELRKINVVKKVISISKKVGIYRLQMKKNSDNIRGSASVDIINKLVCSGAEVWIFEPMLMDKKVIHGTILCKELSELYNKCDIILANRIEKELLPYMDKVYTRDLFYRD